MDSTETGILVMLTILSVGMLVVRAKAKLEAMWLPMYWVLMLITSVKIAGIWDYRVIAGGLVAAMVLRFEFFSEAFEKVFRTIEIGFFGYVFYGFYMYFMRH